GGDDSASAGVAGRATGVASARIAVGGDSASAGTAGGASVSLCGASASVGLGAAGLSRGATICLAVLAGTGDMASPCNGGAMIAAASGARSEERRVGKGGRSWGGG